MRRIYLIIIIPILLLSCTKNPFSSRESDAPTKDAGTFILPISPQIVLENIRLSYAELVISNYIECIDSDFVYNFDYIQGIQIDTSWKFREEIRLTENIFNEFRTTKSNQSFRIDYTLQEDQNDVVLDTSATLVRGYKVSIVDSVGNELESCQGVARFEFIESSFNFWKLHIWEDLHLNSEILSWADLKNAYR